MPRSVTNLVLFLLTFAFAAFACDDPHLRNPVIGGHVLQGGAFRAKKPLKHVQVRVSSENKFIWTGATDKEGGFEIGPLASGKYKLFVAKWGSVTVELNPKLDVSGTGQTPSYSLMLLDNTCVGIILIEN